MKATEPQILENRKTEMPVSICMLSRNALHVHGIQVMLTGISYTFSWQKSRQSLVADDLPEMDLFIFECRSELFLEDIQLFEDLRVRYKNIKILAILPEAKHALINLLGIHQIEGMLLLENLTGQLLRRAIQQVLGEIHYYVDPDINHFTAQFMYQAKKAVASMETESLTKRHQEIIELTAKGYTSEEIGEKLHSTRSNISQHRSAILFKLNVRSMVMAIVKCLATGQLSLSKVLDSGEYDPKNGPLKFKPSSDQKRIA